MIDKESEVFTRVSDALLASDLGLSEENISTIYVNMPRVFPHVCVEMSDSYSVYDDGHLDEQYVRMLFDINIYSNKQDGRKYECKKIAEVIDDAMRGMNFRRIALTPIRNSTQTTVYGTDVHDETVYRLAARYEGTASETHFYRR